MEYINIQQASTQWNITPRRVQELCKNGAIPGATRFGRAWMIPADVSKPADGRKKVVKEVLKKAVKEAENENTIQDDGLPHLPMPRRSPMLIHTDLYNTPGTADALVESLMDQPEASKMLRCQFAFKRGNVEPIYEEMQYFLEAHSGFNAVIGAGSMLCKCAIWRGDLQMWRKGKQHMYEAPCENDHDRQVLEFWLAAVDSTMYDSREFPEWFKEGRFDGLPTDSYGAARVLYVKYLFIAAQDLASGKISLRDVEGLGLMRTMPHIVEPMISQAKMERMVIPETYLHLIAATVYHNLGRKEKAILHVDEAIQLCLPDRLYNILVEHRRNLDSLLDERLALVDEDALKKVRELYKQMNAGWVKLHNLLLERNVSATLTAREREVAKLAAFGLSNSEIGKRLHLEVSSVKRYIFSAMNKVGAEKRGELGLYI